MKRTTSRRKLSERQLAGRLDFEPEVHEGIGPPPPAHRQHRGEGRHEKERGKETPPQSGSFRIPVSRSTTARPSSFE